MGHGGVWHGGVGYRRGRIKRCGAIQIFEEQFRAIEAEQAASPLVAQERDGRVNIVVEGKSKG